jgi:predicted nuclease of predicted toxin-antitoxin system
LRILFDRNVPDRLRRYLPAHIVCTTAEQGWNRLTNGDLLKAAETERFDVLVTADQNLSYQQNLENRTLSLVVLGTNRLSLLEAQPERILPAVEAATAGSFQFIEYELPPTRPS